MHRRGGNASLRDLSRWSPSLSSYIPCPVPRSCKHCALAIETVYNRAMRVTVGVSGGIAAYKAAELVRALQRQGLEVHVVMTESATRFIQPLTFAALTGHKVITNLWDDAGTSEG